MRKAYANYSYVFYLESRVSYLESVLDSHRVPYNSAEVLDNGPQHMRSIPSPIDEREVLHAHNGDTGGATAIRRIHNRKELRQNIQEESSINSCIDPNLAPRTSDPRHCRLKSPKSIIPWSSVEALFEEES